ncbi:2-oxoglutarate-dependent dioxygenase [Xylophilus rhododendri]|uniref:2-oxoglutarate-dependent dioxygenase n=1 Tax=Xylophilus rhododendri TaxID=2697032 RepID=A0A857J326_9BURK|nr:2OG-Fe(II) oxygenase [Xylophilus rhododendri]QHI98057.1 2-oxoglutarate-dependent dioxygenase [Xylophilus rhododendri]
MTTTDSAHSAQAVTPELRRWIIEQAEAGFAAPVILRSMVDAGWREDTAAQAMESTLRSHLAVGQEAAADMPAGVQVPAPALDDAPLYIDAGDRQVHVLQSMSSPHVVVFGNLLSDAECDALIADARPRMKRSLTVATKTGGEEVNADRTSDGMFFARGETPVVQALEARIARLVGWPLANGEGLQVLRYPPGAEYKPHYDYFDPAEPGTPSILKRGGQRVATLVIYLNEPARGGGTVFPDINLTVAPKRGNAVFFSYDRPHPATRTLHGGAPVIEGEKWIATKWLREREFT